MIAVGAGTRIDMTAIIHDSAVIGSGCRIGAHAYVGPSVVIGADCVIKPGAVVGGDGFGYEWDRASLAHLGGRWEPKAHSWGVYIENDVHIGSGTCVDRGSWRLTTIGRGSRIDNLVHVAHNVQVGEDCMVVAHAMLGGSCEVGDGAWIGPSASIMQRVTVGARALVGMGAVVLDDVPENVTVVGNPARVLPGREGVRDVM